MTPRPPRIAEWLVALTLSPAHREREVVLGDLAEEFADMAATDGLRAARRRYRQQVVRSVLPNLYRNLTRPRRSPRPPRPGGTMESIVQDLRYGWRMLVRRPAVTAVAIASLAIGMALPAVVFSLLNAVLLRPLAVADPDRLAVLLEVRKDNLSHNFSYPDFADYAAAQRDFDGMIAYSRSDAAVRTASGTRVVAAELVSGAYFELLGVRLRAGRALTSDDDTRAAAPAVVVSEAFWRELAGDAPFASQTVAVNEQPFTVVGVVAAPFRGMEVGRDVRVWVPLHAAGLLNPRHSLALSERRMSWLTVVARLRDGVSLEQAGRALPALEASVASAAGRTQPRTLTLAPGRQGDSILPSTAGAPLTMLFAAALLVLLVACANVSNLLLVRATERSREIAVRSALGAGRGRLARLVLVEAMLLAAAGGVLAVAAARWLSRLGAAMITSFAEPVTLDMALDWRVLAFVVASGAVTTMAAGLAPAIRLLRPPAPLDGTRGASPGRSTTRAHHAILAAQFALSLALVTAAVFLARTVHNLSSLDTGLDLDRVALATVDPSAARYDAEASRAYVEAAVAALERFPGVAAAGFGRVIPLGFGGSRTTIGVPGYTPAADEDMEINFNTVTPGYFEALGIEPVAGRVFDPRDGRGRPPVVIVNATMAARYWPGRAAVGQRVALDDQSLEVVGVVADVKYRSLREGRRPSFYLPLAQGSARGGVLHIRTEGDPRALLPALPRILSDVDARVPVTGVRTLRDQAALNMNDERTAMTIGVALGLAALLLSGVGLYASMSYLVRQRTKELGVRLALGATARHLRGTVLGQGLRIAAVGTLLGLAAAFALARSLESRFFGVTAGDPLAFALAAGVLAGAALLASWAPARRAARVDPLQALREE